MPLKINQELLLTSENEDAGEEGGNRGYMYINKHSMLIVHYMGMRVQGRGGVEGEAWKVHQ